MTLKANVQGLTSAWSSRYRSFDMIFFTSRIKKKKSILLYEEVTQLLTTISGFFFSGLRTLIFHVELLIPKTFAFRFRFWWVSETWSMLYFILLFIFRQYRNWNLNNLCIQVYTSGRNSLISESVISTHDSMILNIQKISLHILLLNHENTQNNAMQITLSLQLVYSHVTEKLVRLIWK